MRVPTTLGDKLDNNNADASDSKIIGLLPSYIRALLLKLAFKKRKLDIEKDDEKNDLKVRQEELNYTKRT